MPPCGGSRHDEGSDLMKSTIRNRATAFGVATVTGLAGIAFASGPALADSAGLADSTSQSAAADSGTQSVHFPTDPTTYADGLVRAWGNGNTDRVEAFNSPGGVDELDAHRDGHGTHSECRGPEVAAGQTYVDYVSTATGETTSLGLPTEAVHNAGERGEPHAVHGVRFQGGSRLGEVL